MLSRREVFARLSSDSFTLAIRTGLIPRIRSVSFAFFPELRDALSGWLRQGVYKKSFHVEDVYENVRACSCEAAMILFPHVTKMTHSCLEPLSKGHALGLLIPERLLVNDDELAKREIEVLSNLVKQKACYRLHFGQDVLELPGLITPLLERH